MGFGVWGAWGAWGFGGLGVWGAWGLGGLGLGGFMASGLQGVLRLLVFFFVVLRFCWLQGFMIGGFVGVEGTSFRV